MYVLDTNILSELVKQRPNPYLLKQLTERPLETLFTSSICVMELRYGTTLRADRVVFWHRLKEEVLSRVSVLEFGGREALIAGDFLARLHQDGTPIDIEDVCIGATARAHDYTVVTHNRRHFNRLPGVKVEDWIVTA